MTTVLTLRLDKKSNTLNLRLDDSLITESEEVYPGVFLDYNKPVSCAL